MDAKAQATIAELIAALNGEDANEAEEAQATLEGYGEAIVGPLMEATPSFGRFGQLCAIELLQHVGDRRAGSVLIPMLSSEDDTVREWSAQALGDLGIHEAVPVLESAYERTKERHTPPDWTEPQSIRDALTKLGAREEVLPPVVRDIARDDPSVGRCWLPSDLAEVIRALAAARQVVISFMFWKVWRDSRTWVETPNWDLDWSLTWDRLVDAAREDALHAAARAGAPDDVVAVVRWIDKADV